MGRNNADFQHSVMYHGSKSLFNIGDSIVPMANLPENLQTKLVQEKPTHRSGNSDSRRETAFASNHVGVAQLHGKVYTVEPLDKNEVTVKKLVPEEGGKNPILYYTSKKGFKVTGEHSG
jgi:hypothetical protein